ncbi:fcf2 pre-rRNA processing domain-containing protein [Sarocladium implicatum]|nr:fcf2 pre-rRNA processing domain-containing protein [Sarocladium implicatum]
MAALTADEIDQLLGQAERRLGKPSDVHTSTPFVAAGSSVEGTTASAAITPAQPKPEKATLRNPQRSEKTVKDDAGSDWFGMPQTNLSTDFKRDWQILRMRGMLDPKHHKKTLHAKAPKYSQVGEIIAGATDSYGSRLTRKEKKQTLLEEIMSTQDRDKLQTKFAGIMKKKNSGKNAFYQKRGRKQKGYK